MFGLILFFLVFAYFVYNIIQMTKAGSFGVLEGLKMFFFEGIEDFYYWAKRKLQK